MALNRRHGHGYIHIGPGKVALIAFLIVASWAVLVFPTLALLGII